MKVVSWKMALGVSNELATWCNENLKSVVAKSSVLQHLLKGKSKKDFLKQILQRPELLQDGWAEVVRAIDFDAFARVWYEAEILAPGARGRTAKVDIERPGSPATDRARRRIPERCLTSIAIEQSPGGRHFGEASRCQDAAIPQVECRHAGTIQTYSEVQRSRLCVLRGACG